MPPDSHSVVVLISVQAILPHCGSLLGSLVMTARRPSIAVRSKRGIDPTASGLYYCESLVIQIQLNPSVVFHYVECTPVSFGIL